MRAPLNERLLAAADEAARRFGVPAEGRVLESSPDDRAVVEYGTGDARVVAKLRADGAGEAPFHLLQALHAAATPTLCVPEPLAWVASCGVLFTRAARGTPLRHADPAVATDALRRSGRALAELHALPARALGLTHSKTLADHVRELVRPAPEVLAGARPEAAARIRAVLGRLASAEAGWGAHAVTPLHRDFHLRQLFDDGTRITVLDWDDAACGDPAFDVGYLTAYLRTHHDNARAETGIAAFRDGYGAASAVWDRVSVYEQFNYLRRACRRFRLRDAGWEHELGAMFERLAG